jgi:small subunit ribosomal protein S4
VNGKRVTIPTFRVKVGDLVELKGPAKEMAIVLEASQSTERDVPDYLEVDHKKMTGKMVRVPTLGEVPYPVQMEPHLVIEFYSR